MSEQLAILGGPQACPTGTVKPWPPIDDIDRELVMASLNQTTHTYGPNSTAFEQEFAAWNGNSHCITTNSGTAALHMCVVACECGPGDEVIVPAYSWSSSVTCVLHHNAIPVFVDIDWDTINIDVDKIEAAITPRTKAIIVVQMGGYAANMDAFMDISARTGVRILEDYSHSHASTWKGRKVGSIGHVGAASIMSGKPLATGEGGMMNTDDQDIYERAVMFGHGDHHKFVENPEYKRFSPLPWGGYKYRMHQMTSAMARVQLRHYDEYRAPGVKAMERFFSQVCAVPGVGCNYALNDPDVTVGASYWQMLILGDEIIGRVPNAVIARAIQAEGASASPGGYFCHHLHPFWNECDVYGDGKPTRIAFSGRDVRQGVGDCPVAESIVTRLIHVPRMIQYDEAYIDQLAAAYLKVLTNLDQLEGMSSDDVLERSTTLG
ncbi:MAG TPA: hypothetical protein DGT21_13465 [Armatimonadetes bacterium]|nr:hypothetical protein [Armatimonadota bacterium]